jgi:hypothetical protein
MTLIRRASRARVLLATGVLVILLPALAQAQGSISTINFQGELADSNGSLLSGNYNMRFAIYDALTGGTLVWPTAVLAGYELHSQVVVAEGLFSVLLGSQAEPLSAQSFEGSDRYLQIWVCQTPGLLCSTFEALSPRQPVASVGYALTAKTLVHGAQIVSPESYYGLSVETGRSAEYAAAIHARASSSSGKTVGVSGVSSSLDDGTIGVWGQAGRSDGWGYGVLGQTGSHDTESAGVKGTARAGSGVVGLTSSTKGQAGVAGWSESRSGLGYGVYGGAVSQSGIGVQGTAAMTGTVGWATAASGGSYGIYGLSDSRGGYGVYGTNSTGGIGVQGTAVMTGTVGRATATSGRSYGVYGISGSRSGYGVFGTNNSGGIGVFGEAREAGVSGRGTGSGETYGVLGETSSTAGFGVYGIGTSTGMAGKATAVSGTTVGVYGEATSPSGTGVSGEGGRYGVKGVGKALTGSHGVHGQTASTTGGSSGVQGIASGSSGKTYGVYGRSDSPGGFGVYSDGNAHVEGNLSWKAKKGYLSIPPAAFQPPSDDDSYENAGTWFGNSGLTGSTRVFFYAPVHLPHGATITRFTIHYHARRPLTNLPSCDGSPDDGVCAEGRIVLMRTDFSGPDTTSGEQHLVELRNRHTETRGGVYSESSASILSPTVDNSRYAYYVWAGLWSDGLGLTGVVIEYETKGPS